MKEMKEMKVSYIQLILITICMVFLYSCDSERIEEIESKQELISLENITTEENKDKLMDVTGKSNFSSNGCIACHQPKSKIVGPSLETIATAYKDNKEGLIAFLNGEGEAIVDLNQTAIMTPFIETTKAMDEIERAEIAAYILSGKY